MLKKNWKKIVPAVTAIGAFAITSAFAAQGKTTVTPFICETPVNDDDASASIITLYPLSHFKDGSNIALALETYDDDDASVAYGLVVNSAYPTWQQIQFDTTCPSSESFLEVVGIQPNGNVRVQGIDIFDLPLAAKQNNPNGLWTVVATAAYLQSNYQFGKSFQAGTTFSSAIIGQGSDGNGLLVQNVELNNGANANYVMVTAAQNCAHLNFGQPQGGGG